MDEPVKILFKYKNNNGRYQYHTYIFVGNIQTPIMSILKKITDKSLYDTLTFLDKKDYEKLESLY